MAPGVGGLEGVVVADITTSYVDGEAGKLVYAGYSIEDLAAHALFEEVVYLLWQNTLPNAEELEKIRTDIACGAALPTSVINMMKTLPRHSNPMAVLRTAVSSLSHYYPESENLTDRKVALDKATRLVGQVTTLVAAWSRIRQGLDPIAPRIDLTLAENFLWMKNGKAPDKAAADAINVYLVLLAEHGMNASTFAGRVVTATGSDMHSAVVGALGALKGPSHGGANAEAMKMFQEIGSANNVKAWFEREVKGHDRRIMGMGHRVYKAPDPRAAVLKKYTEALAKSSGNMRWFDIAAKLEEVALADEYFIERKLYPNVDYYSAIALYTLGLDIDFFTPLFAMARISGWSAHIIAQMGGRLIRPKANYVGPLDLAWKPIEER